MSRLTWANSGLLPNRERVPTEEYQIGERIPATSRGRAGRRHGPEIILSRARPQFVGSRWKSTTHDEIKGTRAKPGCRTKLAVWSRDEKVIRWARVSACAGSESKHRPRTQQREGDIIKWARTSEISYQRAPPAKLKAF